MTQEPFESFLNDFQKIQIFEFSKKFWAVFLLFWPIFGVLRTLGVQKIENLIREVLYMDLYFSKSRFLKIFCRQLQMT